MRAPIRRTARRRVTMTRMAVLRHRAFRNLFLAQSASTIGDRIVFVALALYVTEIGSPSDVGLVLAAHAHPARRLHPRRRRARRPAAARAGDDRHRPRALRAARAAGRADLHRARRDLAHRRRSRRCTAPRRRSSSRPRPGLLPQTVPEDEIQEAKAASGTMETIAEFTGPALATALVLGLGAGWAFALDSLTFLVSIAFLLRVQAARARRGARSASRCSPTCARAGAPCASAAWLWSILLCFSAAVLLSFAPWFTLGPTVSKDLVRQHAACSACCRRRWAAGTIARRADRLPLAPAAPDAHAGCCSRAAVAAVHARVRARAAGRDRRSWRS